MCSKCTISVLLSWQLSAILAQQACYWPNGSRPVSGQLVNCYSSRASVCCYTGDMCMSNNLCIGGALGMAYRGGCTDKYWSNTTACPDWCNDVHPNDSANIFRCPKHLGFYCDESLSTACQGSEIEVQTYTSATILGTPPISSIEQIATANPSTLTTATSVTESIASSTFKNTPTCTQIIHQSSLRATAIGIGLGAPCGIAAIGFLVFLFWRDAKRKISRSPKQDILGDQRARRHNTLTGGEMDGNGPQLELPGTMITAELHGNEMVQQPNGTAPLAVEPIQTFTLGDRPLD